MARDRVVAETTPPGGRCLATITAVTILAVVALVVVSVVTHYFMSSGRRRGI